MRFWLGGLARLLLLTVPALVLGVMTRWNYGVLLWAVLLMLALFAQWRQLAKLQKWLSAPSLDNVPDASGIWGDTLASLYRINRDHARDRNRLSASLGRFRLAASVFPDGVVILDRENRIEWFNRVAAAQYGFDPARDSGILLTNLIRHPDLASHLAAAISHEALLVKGGHDGNSCYSVVLIPFSDDGRLLISRDVTQIERVEAMRRDFVANVSHELRTPLTVTVGLVEHLVDDPQLEPAVRQRFLTMLQEQLTRMNRLVDDLLTLSRLESGAAGQDEEEVDVPALIAMLIEDGKTLSAGRHRFETAVLPLRLRGNGQYLASAFGNLISNAVRYTPEGGRIRVAWGEEGGQPVFSVEDTGIGIPAEHLPRLTERFYRVDKGRSAMTGGTGLGLAIVKHVLQRHQATLDINSRPGEGSCFRAVFPAHREVSAQRLH